MPLMGSLIDWKLRIWQLKLPKLKRKEKKTGGGEGTTEYPRIMELQKI